MENRKQEKIDRIQRKLELIDNIFTYGFIISSILFILSITILAIASYYTDNKDILTAETVITLFQLPFFLPLYYCHLARLIRQKTRNI